MAWFRKLFGGGKKPANPDQSIMKLQQTEATLEKRVLYLEKRKDAELARCKQLMRQKKKPQALVCLKRKKTYETQIARLNQNIANIQTMSAKLEEMVLEADVLKMNKEFVGQMKHVHGGKSADDIADEIDKTREVMEDAQEISEVLGQAMGGGMEADMFEVDDELEELEAQMQADTLDSVSAGRTALPTAQRRPARATGVSAKDEAAVDAEMAGLMAELAM